MSVVHSPPAIDDIQNHVRYYRRHASDATATRFLLRLEETCERLAAMPGIGSPIEWHIAKYSAVRCFPVKRFPKVLVIYRMLGKKKMELMRVLHGARNIEAILEYSDLDPASE